MSSSVLDAIPSGQPEQQGERLLRSRLAIASLLSAARASGDVIFTEFEDGELFFVSQILRVDQATDSVVASWSPSKAANRLVLDRKRARLHCNHAGARLEFEASHPAEAEFEGRPALRFDLPTALLVLHRRARPRYPVPPHMRLLCRIEGPFGSLSAEVTDISMGGIGAIVHDADTRLEAGTLLENAVIVHPQRGAITVDLKVRHAERIRQPDGRVVRHVGCSFVDRPADLRALIDLFVIDLEAEEDGRGNLP